MTNPKRIQPRDVNKALAAAGHAERLFRAPEGYYYFYDGEASSWYSASIYAFNLDGFTVERILGIRDAFAAEHAAR